MRPKLYLETTIPSYLTARPSRDLIVAGHQQITQEWWSRRKNDFSIYISQFVLDEARGGDREAARDRLSVISQFHLLEVTDEVTELSSAIQSVCDTHTFECPIICTPEELLGE